MSTADTDLTLDFDDEHPLFTLIWETSKAMRVPRTVAPEPEPEMLTIEIRAGDTVQKFGLVNVNGVTWSGARMRMRTTWAGGFISPITPTAAAPAAQTGATPA